MFVSHARKDPEDCVAWVAEVLEERGVRLFVDRCAPAHERPGGKQHRGKRQDTHKLVRFPFLSMCVWVGLWVSTQTPSANYI